MCCAASLRRAPCSDLTPAAQDVSTDLLTDLKTGYLLGTNVRLQILAQCIGMLSSVVLTVPLYYVLIPDTSVIGSDAVCRCWPFWPLTLAGCVCVARCSIELFCVSAGYPPTARYSP